MKLIVLDANFLLYSAKFKIDIEAELERICDFSYELVVPEQVINELTKIGETGKGKDRDAALLALQIASRFEIRKIEARNADEALLKLASGNVLATMDKVLRKRFKKGKSARVLAIRQKKYLIFN